MPLITPYVGYASCPEDIVNSLLSVKRRVLLLGESGSGKSTLAYSLARAINASGRFCELIGADPGSPLFGVPGAVCNGSLQGGVWQLTGLEPLCSLDAGRFRLPLVSAVRRLAARSRSDGILLLDAPGVVRGVAAAELLTFLIEAAGIDLVLALVPEGRPCPLMSEIAVTGAETCLVRPAPDARHPGKRKRRRQRTRLWDAYLDDSEEVRLQLSELDPVGTPPPPDAPLQWQGRQVALLSGTRNLGMGEVLQLTGDHLLLRLAGKHTSGRQLLVRDARRDDKGWLTTAKPFPSSSRHYLPPTDIRPYAAAGKEGGPCPVALVSTASAILVNGVFGDPLLHLRLGNRRRSLLFDLGGGGRLPARIAHQVTDVFISHAHFDHISGFLWLLRSRIGVKEPVRIFGPPGLTTHLAGMIRGILWDRIGTLGPRFEIGELHGDQLHIFGLQTGKTGRVELEQRPAPAGLLLDEVSFKVRATVLDHGTPVLAYGFEHAPELSLCKKSLAASGLRPGPWIHELKQCIASAETGALISLPDGSTRSAAVLAADLLEMTPRQKLVYATDLSDTPANREKLTDLARGAHTLFCEASFIEAHRDHARRSYHLTARACGEIAAAAGVVQLIPFHFSRRYERAPEQIYIEVRAACSRMVEPPGKVDGSPG